MQLIALTERVAVVRLGSGQHRTAIGREGLVDQLNEPDEVLCLDDWVVVLVVVQISTKKRHNKINQHNTLDTR